MKIFIFGATGDLFKRKVCNSLSKIDNLEIYALGRKELSTEDYIKTNLPNIDINLKKRIKYLHVHFSQNGIICYDCPHFYSKNEINYFYIALPPEKIIETLKYVNSVKSQGYSVQILLEKPFGIGLKNSLGIKDFIDKHNLQENLYLADHYLFKEAFLKNKKQAKNIEITNLEKVGLEGRDFYDSVGAINDMVQSHFFNMIDLLLGDNFLQESTIEEFSIGQYIEYQKDLGKNSNTETYVKLKLKKKEILVTLETGKNFKEKSSKLILDEKAYDLNSGKDAYLEMFEQFFKNNKENFPTIEMAINNWKKIEEIKNIKTKLKIY